MPAPKRRSSDGKPLNPKIRHTCKIQHGRNQVQSPVSNVESFGRLVKSWATGLDYVTTPLEAQPPTTAISATATWALPPMGSIHVAIPGSATPATVSAVAMSWNTFEGILHNANNVLPMGTITNPSNATNVVIVQGDNATMVLRLPPKLRISAVRAAVAAAREPGPASPISTTCYSATRALSPTRPRRCCRQIGPASCSFTPTVLVTTAWVYANSARTHHP